MCKTRSRGERGASALEFALIVPLLLTILFGMIDFGLAINRYTMLNNATREGVRAASLSRSQAEVDAAVRSALSDLPGTVTVRVTCETPLGGSCRSWDGDRARGGVAVVTATYEHQWLTPVGKLISPSLTLTKSNEMRIE